MNDAGLQLPFAPLPDGADYAARRRSGEWGYVHSEQTGSALDGPGLRTVVWLSGCLMRCVYCHNPDTWKRRAGKRVHVEDLVGDVARYARFLRAAGGGLTVSGGEPLVQRAFCARLLRRVHELGIHTALDTNGLLGQRLSDTELLDIDLVLLDLKCWDAATHLRVTGQSVEPVRQFARRLAALRRPAWIRFVLVPGVTDQPHNVAGLAQFCATLSNVERVEILPFHQLGHYKWRQLGLPYALERVEAPAPAAVEAVREVFRGAGLYCPE